MQNSGKRWFIAVMATLVHLFLGTVYAWSFFQGKVTETFGWSNSETAWTFSIAIFMLGITASWGGINLPKYGSRKLVEKTVKMTTIFRFKMTTIFGAK